MQHLAYSAIYSVAPIIFSLLSTVLFSSVITTIDIATLNIQFIASRYDQVQL